jgi:hypothetical protein
MSGNSKVRIFAVVCCALLLVACAAQRHRDAIASGLLIQGAPQTAFLEIWGPPERTRTVVSDTEEKRLEFSRFGGFYGRVNASYEVWEYNHRGVILIFSSHELTGWKTDKTTEQLRNSQ